MGMESRSRKPYIALFCIYLAAVAVACFFKPTDMPDLSTRTFLGIPIDKILHFIMFLPYPVLSSMAFIETGRNIWRNLATLCVIAITGIGVAYGTEAIQSMSGYRSYEIKDLYADTVGITTGSVITVIYLTSIRLKK